MPTFAHSSAIDTLQCDTLLLQRLRQSPAYDYHREFIQSDGSIIDQIVEGLQRFFHDSLQVTTDDSMSVYWILGGCLVLVAAGIYLFTHNVGLFRRSGKSELDYDAEDEDIYSIDFDDRIRQAAQQHAWRAATRLVYLKTLRWLADNNRIEWALFKTPSQYTREEQSAEFRTMTNEFLRVRYGNFDATEASFQNMTSLSQELIRNISDELATDMTQSKGGDAS